MSATGWHASEDGPRWIGLDIGGANLKAADGIGAAVSEPFELWKRPGDLAGAVRTVLERFGHIPFAGVALTMTGELADCFATKAEGVLAIVAATERAACHVPVRVATVDDRWLTPAEIDHDPLPAAAANWRVAARLVAGTTTDRGLWIDVGSTTTDLIPFAEGRVQSTGTTDTDRLLAGELLYTGVRRTPVCAIVQRLPYRGRQCPVMAEWFATSADAWLIAGHLPENAQDRGTADGRPLLRAASVERLARCVGADRETFDGDDAVLAAKAIISEQLRRFHDVVSRHITCKTGGSIVLSGEGAFMARLALDDLGLDRIHDASEALGRSATQHLPAHAAAVLACREIGTPA